MVYAIDKYLDLRVESFLKQLEEYVTSFADSNLRYGEDMPSTTWDRYAECRHQNLPWANMYEREFVDPFCHQYCDRLGEFEVTAMLAHFWPQHLEVYDMEGKDAWDFTVSDRRKMLAEMLQAAAYEHAGSCGCELEDQRPVQEQ